MLRNGKFIIKVVFAFILIGLAVTRLFWFDEIGNRIDYVFIILVVLGVLIPFIPWERLTSLKAGASGIEMTLDSAEVKGALKGIKAKVKGVTEGSKEEKEVSEALSKKIQSILNRLSKDLEQFRGSRILWIDDKPSAVLGERRLFRALGAEIVSASSSGKAKEILLHDNDFDAIITDVQRSGKFRIIENSKYAIDGVDFIVNLRKKEDVNLKKKEDRWTRLIPVIFYSGWDRKTLDMLTQPACDISLETIVCNTIDDLIEKTIPLVARKRISPISVPSEKVPTSIY